jgi:hypothetical protein
MHLTFDASRTVKDKHWQYISRTWVWMLESTEFAKTARAHALDRNLRQVPLMNIQAQYGVFQDRLVEETSSLSQKES